MITPFTAGTGGQSGARLLNKYMHVKHDELESGMYPMDVVSIQCTVATDAAGKAHVVIEGLDKVKTYGQLIELNLAVLEASAMCSEKIHHFVSGNNIDSSWTFEQMNLLAANTPIK